MDPKPQELNRLVSLTFDESPKVRLDAAHKLEKIDDPAALFALVELSYDKEVEVKEAALEILDKKKKKEKELMSFAEIFSSGKKKETSEKGKTAKSRKDKVLSPITSIFERRFGKEKAEKVKTKMMPAIEKIYQKSVNRKADNDSGRKAMQEFLTSYLEAVSDIATMDDPEDIEQPEIEITEESQEFEIHEEFPGELEAVGNADKKVDMISKEINEVEQEELAEQDEIKNFDKLPNTVFKKAYETMMLSDGDEDTMRKEMKRVTKNMENDIKLAYQLAKKKFKETNITHLTKLKDRMRNVNTDVLNVTDIEHLDYKKSKKQTSVVTRIIVKDLEGNEGVLYLFDDRGKPIKEGMELKVVKGFVKTFDFSNETALTIGKKGNVYIVL